MVTTMTQDWMRTQMKINDTFQEQIKIRFEMEQTLLRFIELLEKKVEELEERIEKLESK
jgi:hypothetical protein